MSEAQAEQTITLSAEQVGQMLGVIRECSPDGYECFYELILNKVPPRHVMEWIGEIFKSWRAGRSVLNEAFRGSTKTTAVTQILGSYLIGLFPEKTGLIVQVGDEIAKDNADQIAGIIKHNPGWKVAFGNIVPDEAKGWGDKGYWVKRTDIDYGEWTRLKADKDPTFVAYGYTSDAIVGKHPSNFLFIDDIHNEDNTRSAREMAHVKSIYSGTIWMTRNPNYPLTVISFTPWNDNDLYSDVKRTGTFDHILTPVYDKAGEPVWPEEMPRERIEKQRQEDITGGVEFARMLMLDLTARAKRVYKYQLYPAHLMNPQWPITGGCDFAEADDPRQRDAGHSHYALAYLAETPEGFVVVYDGVLEQWSQAEGEQAIRNAQTIFPGWRYTVIEGDGKGETFYNMLYRQPGMKVMCVKTGGKNKAERQVNSLGPWLESGRLRVSSGKSKFLDALRNFMNKYPAVGMHDPGWDAMDAVLTAARGMPHLATAVVDGTRPDNPYSPKLKRENPVSSFGTEMNL